MNHKWVKGEKVDIKKYLHNQEQFKDWKVSMILDVYLLTSFL
jgi:hypothetical protein